MYVRNVIVVIRKTHMTKSSNSFHLTIGNKKSNHCFGDLLSKVNIL